MSKLKPQNNRLTTVFGAGCWQIRPIKSATLAQMFKSYKLYFPITRSHYIVAVLLKFSQYRTALRGSSVCYSLCKRHVRLHQCKMRILWTRTVKRFIAN